MDAFRKSSSTSFAVMENLPLETKNETKEEKNTKSKNESQPRKKNEESDFLR